MTAPITNTLLETLVENGTRAEAEAIAKFARRVLYWGDEVIGVEYAI